MSELPLQWKKVKFGDICRVQGGFAFKSSDYLSAGIPLVRISNLVDGAVQTDSNTVYLSPKVLLTHQNFVLQKGDVLIAMSGATTGKMGVFNLDVPALLNQRVGRFRILSDVVSLPQFVSFLVSQLTRQVLKEAYGAAQPNISPSQIEQIEVPLPPIDEQRRIVAEIEKQFTRLNAGVAALQRVQMKLKRYRASVLKSACEGRLVQAESELARAEGRDYEPAKVLLQRILTERREKWNGRGKYKEPAAPDIAELPELPEGWIWANFDALITSGPQNGVYLPRERYGTGHPILRIDDYQIGWVRDITDLNIVDADSATIETYSLQLNDLVINRVNSLTHLGKCLLVRNDIASALFESNMMRIVLSENIKARYVEIYLHSQEGRGRLISHAKWAVNQASINQQDVKRTPIPLPSLAEQERIVAEVERRISVMDELEATVKANLQRATRLRQSILQQAFNGEL